MGKERYLIEKYRDEHNTLHQAIEIDLYIDEQSQLNEASIGLETLRCRSLINPNLTICYEHVYLDECHQPIKIERLINDEWIEIESKNEEKKYE